ncbi:MAG: ABC transporter ATP-binding protein [Candidatus Borkfalkiaceae bacterium]|nr:ABC transporter ATP-binding protein [Christensenellaceae bacterium]
MKGPVRGPAGTDVPINGKVLKRLIGFLLKEYKVAVIVVALCLVGSAIAGSVSGIFMKNLYDQIENALQFGVDAYWGKIVGIILMMCSVYLLSVVFTFLFTRIGAVVTQGFLKKMREKMFAGMQKLPVRYFDTHKHGDIMSYYTNDIDALRQLISQSIPQFCSSVITVTMVFFIMIYYSVWLTLIVLVAVFAMIRVTAKIGGGSAKYFVRQQRALGKAEGYIEESMNGQKVIKVFNHEEKSKQEFDALNEALFEDSEKANRYANILMPVLGNIGNILYVVIAFVGGFLYLFSNGAPVNLSFENLFTGGNMLAPISLSAVIAFLNMAKQFSNQISQVSNQINSVAMGLAGAGRIFALIDEKPETDEGYVTLVNAVISEDGKVTESETRTGKWAWRHPHAADGTVTYTPLKGDIVMDGVDFGYTPDKIVLHDVSLHAEPGKKFAFVGATGAGKTTITNLINRFYDIADGKIRYDGINVNKIRKSDLRRSLGIVLQDTNLFTGTVMENIRYGKLDATDEEVYAAAKLANAHSFITRLPQGYQTMLTSDGANLSQGQRQLLSIARAAVCNAPVMIMDEATSSIDTRTELIVQQGTDRLMEGRTVFVIAHRLSTVQNSDVITVLDHGHVIEQGNHDQLIAKKGKYYQLYTGAFELE